MQHLSVLSFFCVEQEFKFVPYYVCDALMEWFGAAVGWKPPWEDVTD